MRVIYSKYSYLLLAVAFAIVISFNFAKPMGFFRESNAALVCINANTWMQNDSIKKQHIPVTSYSFNYNAPSSTQLYNTCPTFGYAWFAVPYYFFSLLHIPVGAIELRLFSLCWLAFTLIAVYLLAKTLIQYYKLNKNTLPITLWLYLLSPAILWYNVQGYVHEIAAIPFYLLGWLYFLKYLQGKESKHLLLTSLMLLIGVQFDWLPCMQALTITLYLMVQRKQLKQQWAFTVPALAILIGLAYIFYTYANWAGTEAYITHMQSKFLSRTVGAGKFTIVPFISHHFNLIIFYGLGFGLTALLFIIGLKKLKIKNPVLWLMIATAALHHFIFWGFSSEHDHAAVKMAFPVAFVAAMYTAYLKQSKQLAIFLLTITISISFYFLLHNYTYRKGMYTNQNYCYDIGNAIKRISIDPKEYVFLDTENKYFQQIEFYSGKYYTLARSLDEAKQLLLKKEKNAKGIFIETIKGRYKYSQF